MRGEVLWTLIDNPDGFMLGAYADGTKFKFPITALYKRDVWLVHRKVFWKYVDYAARIPYYHGTHCTITHKPTGYCYAHFTSLKRARGMVDWLAVNHPGYQFEDYSKLSPETIKDWRGVLRSFKGWR